MKTYVFRVQLEEEEDGRWSVWIDALPGCAAWGYTKEEALEAIQDAAEAYVEDLLETGEKVPDGEAEGSIPPLVTVAVA